MFEVKRDTSSPQLHLVEIPRCLATRSVGVDEELAEDMIGSISKFSPLLFSLSRNNEEEKGVGQKN